MHAKLSGCCILYTFSHYAACRFRAVRGFQTWIFDIFFSKLRFQVHNPGIHFTKLELASSQLMELLIDGIAESDNATYCNRCYRGRMWLSMCVCHTRAPC